MFDEAILQKFIFSFIYKVLLFHKEGYTHAFFGELKTIKNDQNIDNYLNRPLKKELQVTKST